MSKKYSINWLETTKESNYDSALSYLTLLLPESEAIELIEKLKVAPISEFQAKDILRASELPLLDETNQYVARDIKKIEAGEELSPILLVRGKNKLTICDGYHRLCGIYHVEENILIKAKIV